MKVRESEAEFSAVSDKVDKVAVMVKLPSGMELISIELENAPFWQVVEESMELLYLISTRPPFSEQVPEMAKLVPRPTTSTGVFEFMLELFPS